MKILFLTRLFYPHIGGVEKHVYEISQKLNLPAQAGGKSQKITVITEKFDENLKDREIVNGIKIIRFSYPKARFFGLLKIWIWLFRNRRLISESDIVHCHDVFIWYLPFRFLFFGKRVYTTFHGWEGVYPVSVKNILLKRLAARLSWGNICVGRFIEKYYGIKADVITYGGVETQKSKFKSQKYKSKGKIVFLGRLEKDTGISKLFDFLGKHKKYRADFCGDGVLRSECEKYGRVYGFVDPAPFLKKKEICFAAGYLSAMEAVSFGCKLMVGWSNPLKKDYWKSSPFLGKNVKQWVGEQTWEKLADEYQNLYRNNS